MSAAWKNAERQAAKALGGKRNQRGADFSQSQPDHPLFSVEVKYRKALPRLLRLGLAQAGQYDPTKPPVLVIKEKYQKGALVVMKLSNFVDLVGTTHQSGERRGMMDVGIPSVLPDKRATVAPTTVYAGGLVSDPMHCLFVWRTYRAVVCSDEKNEGNEISPRRDTLSSF